MFTSLTNVRNQEPSCCQRNLHEFCKEHIIETHQTVSSVWHRGHDKSHLVRPDGHHATDSVLLLPTNCWPISDFRNKHQKAEDERSGCMQLHGPAKSMQLAKMSFENKLTRRAIANLSHLNPVWPLWAGALSKR